MSKMKTNRNVDRGTQTRTDLISRQTLHEARRSAERPCGVGRIRVHQSVSVVYVSYGKLTESSVVWIYKHQVRTIPEKIHKKQNLLKKVDGSDIRRIARCIYDDCDQYCRITTFV